MTRAEVVGTAGLDMAVERADGWGAVPSLPPAELASRIMVEYRRLSALALCRVVDAGAVYTFQPMRVLPFQVIMATP